MELYGAIKNINRGVRNHLHMLHTIVMRLRQSASTVMKRICWAWVNTVSTST